MVSKHVYGGHMQEAPEKKRKSEGKHQNYILKYQQNPREMKSSETTNLGMENPFFFC